LALPREKNLTFGRSDAGATESLLRFGLAVAAMGIGVLAAAGRFPGGFDWAYTVVSRLASSRHNPAGAPLICAAALVAVFLIWPVPRCLSGAPPGSDRLASRAAQALRFAFVGVTLLAVEGLLRLETGSWIRKGHEALALLTFLAAYMGILGLYSARIREDRRHALPFVAVLTPLVGVGLTQVILYLDQRDLGWVNQSWREMGIPLWLSFAFWQWVAIGLLGLGLGHLILTAPGSSRE
jgi:hypothetical protein